MPIREAIDLHPPALPDIQEAWNASLDAMASTSGLPRWRIDEIFAYGACSILARTLAEHTGLDIGIVTAGGGYAHAFVMIDGDHVLDVFGVRPVAAVLAAWREDDEGASIRGVDNGWFEGMPIGSLDLPLPEVEEMADSVASDFSAYLHARSVNESALADRQKSPPRSMIRTNLDGMIDECLAVDMRQSDDLLESDLDAPTVNHVRI